jgi:hypothetical protein
MRLVVLEWRWSGQRMQSSGLAGRAAEEVCLEKSVKMKIEDGKGRGKETRQLDQKASFYTFCSAPLTTKFWS